MATSLDLFTDLVNVTGSGYPSTRKKYLNDAMKTKYSFDRFLKGKDLSMVMQGGRDIRDVSMFDESNTSQNYNPNVEVTYTQPQVTVERVLQWRFVLDYMSWTEHEILLNAQPGMSDDYVDYQFKKLLKVKQMRLDTSMLKFNESELWADAGGTTLEAAMESTAVPSNGGSHMSIPAYITEDTTNFVPRSWTTVLGLNPANEPQWRNQVSTYDFDDPDDSDGDADGLIDAFDEISLNVQFEAPDFHKESFEQSYEVQRNAIYCSAGGLNQYKRLLRASNDTLIRKQDAAYPGPEFDGVPLVRVSELDAATIVWDGSLGSTASTELGGTGSQADGFRYFWLNGSYMSPIWHTEKFFQKGKAFSLEKQPFTRVAVCDSWWNLWCSSRLRNGIVAPQ